MGKSLKRNDKILKDIPMMPNYEKELHWVRSGKTEQRKISFWQSVKAILLPVLLQVICVLIVSHFDPCNNNPRCMAGTITGFSAIIIIPPTLVILFFITLVEVGSRKVEYQKALTINSILAILPFVLIFMYLARIL